MIRNPTSHSCPERGEVCFWFSVPARIRESVPKLTREFQGRASLWAFAGIRGSEWVQTQVVPGTRGNFQMTAT
jgi:hypothetical protein